MDYTNDVGKTVYSRDGEKQGTVTGIIRRYCAACGTNGPAYSVRWTDGKRTYPCPKGVRELEDGSLRIN